MIGFGAQTQVYLVAGATDMRKQIDGLAALVVDVTSLPTTRPFGVAMSIEREHKIGSTL